MPQEITALEIIDKIATYLIPVISVAISFFIGRYESRSARRVEIAKERYEKFYVPFIRMIFEQGLMYESFSDLSFQEQMKIYRLLLDNLQYMDCETLDVVEPIFAEFSLYLMSNSKDDASQQALRQKNLDSLFNEMIASMLSQARELSKELSLPQIAETTLSDYRIAKKLPEKQPSKWWQFLVRKG